MVTVSNSWTGTSGSGFFVSVVNDTTPWQWKLHEKAMECLSNDEILVQSHEDLIILSQLIAESVEADDDQLFKLVPPIVKQR